jgi:hypothetical protein|tara:strand:+ start:3441 stop:3776 length:336 start_codon:yes stop_codon:yes gene_type:complete
MALVRVRFLAVRQNEIAAPLQKGKLMTVQQAKKRVFTIKKVRRTRRAWSSVTRWRLVFCGRAWRSHKKRRKNKRKRGTRARAKPTRETRTSEARGVSRQAAEVSQTEMITP